MRRIASWRWPVVVGVAGMLMAHEPMLTSGLRRVQTDLVDTRLNHYFLEHGFRWLVGRPGHERFWDPPFFYPARNVGAYSDIFLTVAPPYWALRLAGVRPETAFPLWMLLFSVLNYAGALALLRRGFGLSLAGASAGAFVFAFSAMRVDEVTHQQLIPHAFTLLLVYALLRWGRSGGGAGWVALGAAGVVGQLYAGFYLGWFLLFSLGLAAAMVPLDRAWREGAVRGLRRDALAMALTAGVSALLLWPMLSHYLEAAREVGMRKPLEVWLSVGDLRSWIYLGPNSLLFGWMPNLDLFHGIPVEQSHRKGMGLVTPVLAASGLFLGWRRPEVRLLSAVGLALWVCATAIPRWVLCGLSLSLLGVCVAELVWGLGGPSRRWALGTAVLGLGAVLFAPWTVALGLAAAAVPAAAVGWLLLRPRTTRFALPALTLWLAGTTFPHARIIALGVLGPLAWWAVRRRGLGRELPVVPIVAAAWGIVAALLVFNGQVAVWGWVYAYVPGGNAIRVVTRAGLFLLLPAGVGLGLAFDRLRARGPGARVLALALALVCAAEQAMKTPSFDQGESRAAIRSVADRVDRSWETFYYSPACPPRFDPHIPQIDAMWAALECGVPTINGYSGNMPPGWAPLEAAALGPEGDAGSLRAPLDDWIRQRGLNPTRVGWIGPRPGPPRSDAPPPGVRARTAPNMEARRGIGPAG